MKSVGGQVTSFFHGQLENVGRNFKLKEFHPDKKIILTFSMFFFVSYRASIKLQHRALVEASLLLTTIIMTKEKKNFIIHS